jgi:hypothetical protein
MAAPIFKLAAGSTRDQRAVFGATSGMPGSIEARLRKRQ